MKIVAFDFDGVIANTEEFSKGILRKIGLACSDEDFAAHHDGNVYETPRIPFTDDSAEEFFKEYSKNVIEQECLIPSNIIKELSKRYELYIISSNAEEVIKQFLKGHNIDFFKEILGYRFHKLKEKKLEYLLKLYPDTKKHELIFITDTLGDIVEAHKVGVKSLAVDFGFHDRERLMKGKPFKIISNYDTLFEDIEEATTLNKN